MTFLSRPIASTICFAERSDSGGQRPHLREEGRQRVAVGGGHRAPCDRQVGGGQHSVAHGFAVAEAAVLRHRLERVAERMPEVERAARS